MGFLFARIQAFRHRHERAEHVLFFGAGFVFDALMVTRIDDAPVLIQQGVYLGVVGLLLAGLLAWNERGLEPPRGLRAVWSWAVPVLHFLLGTLLNAYALFYFKAASGLIAAAFVVVIAALLLVNELPQMRRFGPVVIFGLYSVCLTSYFAYLYPVLLGRLRSWMFVAAIATSLVPLAILGRLHHAMSRDAWRVVKHAVVPALSVQAVLLLLFVLRLIPPVPLSLVHIGIYHAVSRNAAAGTYTLSHEPAPWWRVWARDDRNFHGRPGDRVYCFVRVFAPRAFHDEIRVRWWKRSNGEWVSSDALPIAINGGREEGFGGYAYKQNWTRGDWRVTIETRDGREIGRRTFTLFDDVPSSGQLALVTTTK